MTKQIELLIHAASPPAAPGAGLYRLAVQASRAMTIPDANSRQTSGGDVPRQPNQISCVAFAAQGPTSAGARGFAISSRVRRREVSTFR
jgi:hypothetical protein